MTTSEAETTRTDELTVLNLTMIKHSSVVAGLLLFRLVPSPRRFDPRVPAAVIVALGIEPRLKAFRRRTR
jgi:hypothetical protein